MNKNTANFFVNLFVTIVLILCMVWVALNYIGTEYEPQMLYLNNQERFKRMKEELPLAKKRWEDHHITDYDIDIEGLAHPVFCSYKDSSEPRSMRMRSGTLIYPDDGKPSFACSHMENYLPPKVFEIAQNAIEQMERAQQGLLQISFDPEYGYVTEFVYRLGGRATVLTNFTISNLRIRTP